MSSKYNNSALTYFNFNNCIIGPNFSKNPMPGAPMQNSNLYQKVVFTFDGEGNCLKVGFTRMPKNVPVVAGNGIAGNNKEYEIDTKGFIIKRGDVVYTNLQDIVRPLKMNENLISMFISCALCSYTVRNKKTGKKVTKVGYKKMFYDWIVYKFSHNSNFVLTLEDYYEYFGMSLVNFNIDRDNIVTNYQNLCKTYNNNPFNNKKNNHSKHQTVNVPAPTRNGLPVENNLNAGDNEYSYETDGEEDE